MQIELLESYINSKIREKEVWAVISGYGSYFHIEIGKKIKKTEETQNENLPIDARIYKGEYSFDIYSPWRLENKNKIVKSWKTVEELDPELLNLAGEKIVKIIIDFSCDLLIIFTSGKSISVFCDEGDDACWGFVENNIMHSVTFQQTKTIDYII